MTIQNTGGNGIAVTNGTLNIFQGVTVTNAGSALKHHDGLNVSGGIVNIAVMAGQATTSFNNNSEHGIYVTGSAALNIVGVPVTSPAPNGQGTVISTNNAFDGLEIFETPSAAAQSSIFGLVAWGNSKHGIQLFGGEKVKVRSSVLLNNKLNGMFITSADVTAAANSLAGHQPGHGGRPGPQPDPGRAGLELRPDRPLHLDGARTGDPVAVGRGERLLGPDRLHDLDQQRRPIDLVRRQRRPGHRARARDDRDRRPGEVPVGRTRLRASGQLRA